MLTYTPPLPGSVAPIRSGFYTVDPRQHAYFDVDAGAWSEAVDEFAGVVAHNAAREQRMPPERVAALRWSGLTRRSHAWLAAELARP